MRTSIVFCDVYIPAVPKRKTVTQKRLLLPMTKRCEPSDACESLVENRAGSYQLFFEGTSWNSFFFQSYDCQVTSETEYWEFFYGKQKYFGFFLQVHPQWSTFFI